jgi:hypothetical protein
MTIIHIFAVYFGAYFLFYATFVTTKGTLNKFLFGFVSLINGVLLLAYGLFPLMMMLNVT